MDAISSHDGIAGRVGFDRVKLVLLPHGSVVEIRSNLNLGEILAVGIEYIEISAVCCPLDALVSFNEDSLFSIYGDIHERRKMIREDQFPSRPDPIRIFVLVKFSILFRKWQGIVFFPNEVDWSALRIENPQFIIVEFAPDDLSLLGDSAGQSGFCDSHFRFLSVLVLALPGDDERLIFRQEVFLQFPPVDRRGSEADRTDDVSLEVDAEGNKGLSGSALPKIFSAQGKRD